MTKARSQFLYHLQGTITKVQAKKASAKSQYAGQSYYDLLVNLKKPHQHIRVIQAFPEKITDFTIWETIARASQQITDREGIEKYLLTKLGQPTNETQTNLLQELTKKINSYYHEPHPENYTTYSLIGSVQEIAERIRKTGKRKGQLDYDLKLANKETLQARKEDLPPEK
ncbi:6558_t:CDS:2 [Entrophospora sp. SA101]|nr:6558_t:CDS:2 [Entrophospora sp. SA101]